MVDLCVCACACVCAQDLLPDMEKSWPDLLAPTSDKFWYSFQIIDLKRWYIFDVVRLEMMIRNVVPTRWVLCSFRKYEWFKHGTCAAQAASLNSQHKYFSKALELYHKVDLDGYDAHIHALLLWNKNFNIDFHFLLILSVFRCSHQIILSL